MKNMGIKNLVKSAGLAGFILASPSCSTVYQPRGSGALIYKQNSDYAVEIINRHIRFCKATLESLTCGDPNKPGYFNSSYFHSPWEDVLGVRADGGNVYVRLRSFAGEERSAGYISFYLQDEMNMSTGPRSRDDEARIHDVIEAMEGLRLNALQERRRR